MPGGPYDLWREGEDSRRVKDLVGAFAQFPKLPKMLRPKEVLDTVVDGVRQGIWVARLVRPDRTARTFWRTDVDETALQDPALEVLLPEASELSGIPPGLLVHEKLPGLWSAGGNQRAGCVRLLRRRPHRGPAYGRDTRRFWKSRNANRLT